VRSALGAPHGRLIAHLFAESLGLATLGGALGIAMAYGGVAAIVHYAGALIPRPEAIALDGGVLLFAAAASLGSGILFGLTPGLRVLRGARIASIASVRGGGALARKTGRIRRTLVLAEIATTVVLVVGAGLLLKSLWNLHRVELGVEREGVVTMELHGSAWWDLKPETAATRYREVFDAVGALPGVQAGAAIDVVPLSDNYSCDGVTPLDRPPPAPGDGRCAEVRSATPGIFEALGIPLLRGRAIAWSDDADAPGSAVFSERAAEVFWPGENALGQTAVIRSDTFTVVGIVADVRHFGPAAELNPAVYLPATQEPWNGIARGLTLVVRGGPGVDGMLSGIRNAVRPANPAIAIGNVRTMDALLSARVGAPRFRAFLLGSFAALALLLALVGIAGVMAYSVVSRTREFGIRIALGAAPMRVTGSILAEGARLTLGGLALGLLAAIGLTRLLRSLVFEVGTLDAGVVAIACVAVSGCALLACWLPARRASRIDPVRALRAD
jgi:predicted permease